MGSSILVQDIPLEDSDGNGFSTSDQANSSEGGKEVKQFVFSKAITDSIVNKHSLRVAAYGRGTDSIKPSEMLDIIKDIMHESIMKYHEQLIKYLIANRNKGESDEPDSRQV